MTSPYEQLATAAAELAHRQAAKYGKTYRDGTDDLHPAEPSDSIPALPTTVHLTYESDSGEVTERVVTLLAAWSTPEAVYFKGRCHLRKSTRTFRADHVVELICLATGEVPENPAAWIVAHALYEGMRENDYTPHALRLCRDELAMLAYVARADGMLDPDEVEVMADYVMMSTERPIDRDNATQYIQRLSPSWADLDEHLEKLGRRPERWSRLSRAMRRLVDADRIIAIEEQIAWTDISARLEERRETYDRLQREKEEEQLKELLSDAMVVKLRVDTTSVRSMIAAAMNRAAQNLPSPS